jgi:hypothetical protein
MPFVHGKSTAVFLGGSDVSSFLNSVDQTITRDVSETSTFGADAKSYIKGHKDGTISLSGYWDGASGAIDSVMASALGNEVLGYGSELLPAGELLANYQSAGNVTQDTTTPIAGFSASIQFGDNSLARSVAKSASVTNGQKYLFSFWVRMDDGSVPIPGPPNNTADFRILTDSTDISTLTNRLVELVSGNIYRVFIIWTATSTATVNFGIAKWIANSNKSFRIAGLSIRAVATVQQTRQVDTYGSELLTAGEVVTDYPVRQNVSQAGTPIAGFSDSLQFGDNSVVRFAIKSNYTIIAGLLYRFSATIQMDNNDFPIAGTQSDIASDFVFGVGNVQVSTRSNTVIQLVAPNIYNVSIRLLGAPGLTFPNYQGVYKFTGNSSRQFRAGGYSLRQITPVTVPTAPPLSICEAGTSTAGLRALVVQAHDTSYQVTGTTGDTVAVSCEFQVDGSFGSGAFRGVVLAPLTSYATGTNTTAVDNGSTTFGGLVANVHVLANPEWVTVKIQHSTDNSTWVDLLTSTSFSQNSSEHLTTPNVVYRYLRVNVTASGSTTPRVIVTAARK